MIGVRAFVVAVVCGILAATASHASAAPGELDPDFGSGGIVITDLGNREDVPVLALQADGKLVAASSTLVLEIPYPEAPAYPDMAVVRYNTDGSLDPSWGSDGVVTTAQGFYTYEDSRAIVIQPDGKIVVGGASTLVRYETDGTLDVTFGGDGIIHASVTDLVLQPDGKIVATGVGASPGNYYDFQLVRYDADGTLDPTFGSGGVVNTPIGTGYEVPFAVVLQPDGKLVAAGDTETPQRTFALVRYESDGSLDPTFGNGGIVIGPNDSYTAYALLLQPDGKLVAGGSIAGAFGLARYNDDGSLDTAFGNGGVTPPQVGGTARSIVMQPNGKLIAAGDGGVTVIAYNPDGSPDPTFGNWGVVTTSLPHGGYANAIVLQPDAKVVVAGAAYGTDAFFPDFFLARYDGAAEPIVIPSPTATSTAATPTISPTPTTTPSPPCPAVPVSGCLQPSFPAKSQLSLKDKTPDGQDKLLWTWGSGPAIYGNDFADPTYFSSYAFCVYDRVAGVPTLVLAASIPSNVLSGPCGTKPCWRFKGTGFRYSNKEATPHGITAVQLNDGRGVSGKGRLKVLGKGVPLPMPSFPLAQSYKVTAQLMNSYGACWGAEYTVPALTSSTEGFKDRSD